LNDLNDLGVAKVHKKKEKGKEILDIQGISPEDLQRIARARLIQVCQKRQGYFFSLLPRSWSRARVKFAGNLQSFYVELPGSSVDIVLPYQTRINGVEWFGPGGFGGLKLTLRIERGWSYTQALEKLAQNQKYRSTVQAVQEFAQKLESRGMAAQAVLVEKRALSLLLQGQTNLNPLSLLHGH